ncbi:MAG: hypothetical protein M3Q29_05845, partial [Chloroflexota bacterium]|nr:hypothetical protein [Chloroflexota bacterium]
MHNQFRKPFNAVLALALLLALVAGASSPVSAGGGQTFTIVLTGESVTQSALSAIQKAGGVVVTRIDQIGVLEVQASNPTAFLKAMLRNSQVANVGPTLQVELDLPQVDGVESGAAESLGSTDPMDWAWNIDRVTGNGAAWDVHTG